MNVRCAPLNNAGAVLRFSASFGVSTFIALAVEMVQGFTSAASAPSAVADPSQAAAQTQTGWIQSLINMPLCATTISKWPPTLGLEGKQKSTKSHRNNTFVQVLAKG